MKKLSKTLSSLEKLVDEIVNQPNAPLYTIIDQGGGLIQVKPTPLANRLFVAVEYGVYPLLEQFPIYEYHPYLSVFINTIRSCNLFESIADYYALRKQNHLYIVGTDYEAMLEVTIWMQTCINQIRQEVNSPAFKTLIKKADRASEKNLDGLLPYIDSLLDHYSKLLVVRVDLGYHEGNHITSEAEIEQKYFEAKQDFERFLKNTKMNRIFTHKVGYIWSLEYGPDKGFHYHLYLFFDGSQVRQDVTLATMIGEYWEHSITDNRGVYRNLNAKKHKYRYCGIGMIHHSDSEKRDHLKSAAAYLAKVDHYARMLIPGNGRTFGRGEILPPRIDGPGRPRSAVLAD